MATNPGELNFGFDALDQKLTLNGQCIWGGIVGPFFSPAGAGSIYFDFASQRLKASENGGAPVNLLTGGGGGSAYEIIQNAHVSLPQENKLSFDGTIIRATDNSGATATDVTIQQADATHSGYLSSTDWSTFNTSSMGSVPSTRNINTTAPLQGGGDLSADRTLSITQSDATHDGFLSSVDWNTFNNKVPATRAINSGTGLTGGGDLSADRTLALANTAVTPGSYTNTNLTVDQQGRITAASNGSGGSGSTTNAKARETSGGQMLSSGVQTLINFNSADFDTSGGLIWVIGSPTRLTIQTTGYYQVTAIIGFSGQPSTNWFRQVQLFKNGVAINDFVQVGPSNGNPDYVLLTTTLSLVATDYLEVAATQNSGSPETVAPNTTFMLTQVG